MKHTAFFAAGIMILQAVISPFALAKIGLGGQSGGTVTGFVVPTLVGANEPFTFAAKGVVAGEVISVKTVEGEIVKTQKADKHGRVFLAAGLAAGAYLLSAKGGKNTSNFEVQPPRNLPSGNSLTIPQVPGAFNAQEGFSLSGEGMSPNAADMSVKFGKTEFPVLAGTATEMNTGPLPSSACGAGPVAITNNNTGDVSTINNVVCYELSAKLGRTKLANGEASRLDFTFKPADYKASVDVQILSGPISIDGGTKERTILIENGSGSLKLVADPGGQGPFRVAYNIHEIMGAGKLADTFIPLKPGGATGGEKPEPADNKKKERCPLTKHIRDTATGWNLSEKDVADPDNPGKTKKVYIASRTVRCSIHKSCSKDKGHGGSCAFTGSNQCKVHDITETREYASERERKDGVKDTAIPEGLRNPEG